ncbi:MAG: BlaI/MecI/CopY family transcriptional regulator [Planctomycetaceae bacterium]
MSSLECEEMAEPRSLHLGRRERQIVEAVYRLGEASVAQVRDALPDPPSYSAVRAMLNLLVDKQVLTLRQEGKRYLYRPVASRERTGRAALKNLVRNFFAGQPLDAVAALLDGTAGRLTADDLGHLRRLIDDAETRR